MDKNYTLPIDGNWSVEDIVTVSTLVDSVLKVYENGVKKEILMNNYRNFLAVIPSKSEQKQFDKDFEKQTGYSIYRTMKFASQTVKDKVKQ
ncbi:UPF0223 family protein [Leuconostoc palmae]|uniref:UPF0223 family protein n=1 Tax=Leuconostoc palmae TaxID=501487 RepID=UPI001C7D46FB|nr:UPF0223 family protein [Leuconostoc palmae]